MSLNINHHLKKIFKKNIRRNISFIFFLWCPGFEPQPYIALSLPTELSLLDKFHF